MEARSFSCCGGGGGRRDGGGGAAEAGVAVGHASGGQRGGVDGGGPAGVHRGALAPEGSPRRRSCRGEFIEAMVIY